jgi:hypothetical protein
MPTGDMLCNFSHGVNGGSDPFEQINGDFINASGIRGFFIWLEVYERK